MCLRVGVGKKQGVNSACETIKMSILLLYSLHCKQLIVEYTLSKYGVLQHSENKE